MISIIISSTDPILLANVKQNIADTIGVPSELITVDNKSGKRGLCEIYNSCAIKASYEILCFMHEDLRLITRNWGLIVLDIFKKDNVGLLGIAGGDYKALTPAGWACPGIESVSNKVNIIQCYKYTAEATRHESYNSKNESLATVATIDGVWMCTRKSIALEMKFDEVMLRHFHGYDLDFSLKVVSKYEVLVTYEILLEHFSEGNYSAEWLDAVLRVNWKFRNILPFNKGNYNKHECRFAEKSACKKLLRIFSDQGFGKWKKIAVLWNYKLYRVLGVKQFMLFNLNILVERY
jgi:hypothetical protein